MFKVVIPVLETVVATVVVVSATALLAAGSAEAQRAKPPLSLEASQTGGLPPQFGQLPAAAPAPVYQAAPMPNSDLYAPLPPTSKTAEVSPSLFQPRRQFRGDGFSYGSTAQTWQEQRLKPAPGVSLKVPLE